MIKNRVNIPYNRFSFIAILSLVYVALYSSASVHNIYALNGRKAEMLFNVLLSYEFAFIMLFSLTCLRSVFIIFLPFIFLISAVSAYFITEYKIRVDERSLALLFETPTGIINDFITYNLIWTSVSSLLISALAIWIFLKYDKKNAVNAKAIFLMVSFVFFAVGLDNNINQNMPYNILNGGVKYTASKLNLSTRYDVANLESKVLPGNEDLIVVLVIGESARADKFHINGYERETTPNLEKIRNLINFPNVRSCSNLSIESKPCLLTRAEYHNRKEVRETSFISIFRKLNFDTIWFDNAHLYEQTMLNLGITNIISESEVVVSKGYRYDTDYIDVMDQYIDNAQTKTLMVVDTKGTHWPYDNNYTVKQWQPICNVIGTRYGGHRQAREMSECNPEALINSYDNSILAVDKYLSELINLLESKNALLVYVADHGESLGEEGFFLHGQGSSSDTRVEQFHVPMMIWASDMFRQRNSKKVQNIEAHSQKFIRHNSIFHSVLDCAGIESQALDKSLSLCSDLE
ncbi:MAG: phosphoethanolamine transferase [Rickettsiales bacterium]|nr:phosphoethanolamine transferase [Rickettsiales bacterium]